MFVADSVLFVVFSSIFYPYHVVQVSQIIRLRSARVILLNYISLKGADRKQLVVNFTGIKIILNNTMKAVFLLPFVVALCFGNAITSRKERELDWWESTIFYQIYPRSFADSDGDGIGDLNGKFISITLFHYSFLHQRHGEF